jgi:hypothetical protein
MSCNPFLKVQALKCGVSGGSLCPLMGAHARFSVFNPMALAEHSRSYTPFFRGVLVALGGGSKRSMKIQKTLLTCVGKGCTVME